MLCNRLIDATEPELLSAGCIQAQWQSQFGARTRDLKVSCNPWSPNESRRNEKGLRCARMFDEGQRKPMRMNMETKTT